MEQKWLTKNIEYEGFPLYLRKPDYQDIFASKDNFPNVLHVTQNLKEVKGNGLPESDYNESLFEFDGQMCKLFDKGDEGIIFLIETFAGKRHYYYFISDSVDYEKRMEKIKKDNPDVDIETHSYADKDWGFLKDRQNCTNKESVLYGVILILIVSKMRRLCTVILLIACSFIVFECSDDGTDYARQKFVGEWEISEVIYDGVSQPDWVGATLTFTRMAMDSGAYSLPETPYDSIWSSLGHWIKLADDYIFYREDKINVQYWIDVDEKKMTMDLYLPWTQQSTCTDSVCLPIVTGHWIFELKK